MSKTVRVGHTIYKGSERIAEFTHGAWYRYKKKRGVRELDPCDAELAAQYEGMVDATTAPISDGELAVLRIASKIVRDNDVTGLAMVEVEKGIKYGITKHGPYDPDTDDRDLVALVTKSLRNVVVYCSMELARPNPRGQRSLLRIAGAAVVALRQLDSVDKR